MTGPGKLAPLAARGVAAGAAGLATYFLWRSLAWPLIHDAAGMHYIAWLIANGAAPYRDVFDMNMPGGYLLHVGVLTTGGAGSAAFRAFDVGWLGATAILLFLYCRPAGDRAGAATAALLFAIQHLSGGPSLAGERDFLLCLFLVGGALGVARWWERGGRLAPLGWAGLALGFAVMVKPLAGLFLAGCAAGAAAAARRAGRPWRAPAAILLGGGLVAPGLIFAWLAWIGGLTPFVWTLTQWTMPLYSQLGAPRPFRVLVSIKWGLLGAAAAIGAIRPARSPFDVRRLLAIGGAAYGVLHFAIQAKGYDYHLYPLACFLSILAGLAISPRTEPSPDRERWLGGRAIALAAAAVVALAVVAMGDRGIERVGQPWEAHRTRRVDAAVADLRKLVGPADTVQVLGVPGAHVLLQLGIKLPTRFFTDFQFYAEPGDLDPRIRALRAEFVEGLEIGRPAAILAFPGRGPGGPYGRFAEFPEFARLLDRRYAIAVEGNGYRIYARRAGG